MSYIDSHAHLDFKEFDSDLDQVIERARAADIKLIVNVGTNVNRSLRSVELAQKYPEIYAAVGIHPHDLSQVTDQDVTRIDELLRKNKVIALGEVGLDYFRKLSPRKTQQDFLRAFFDLAARHNKPVILHCRDAFSDLVGILNEYPTLSGVAHCFLGNWQTARQFLNRGFLISFTGAITYPGKNHDALIEVIKNVPLDSFLIETDSPYLAPIPFRGKRNEPSYVIEVAKYIGALKNLTPEKIGGHALENAKYLFKLISR